jgi:photosystem II stability/assembly factor-like uncharacterized protein
MIPSRRRLIRKVLLLSVICLPTVLLSQEWRWVNPRPTGESYSSAFIQDSLHSWIVGGNAGVVVSTTDGGNSWSPALSGYRTMYSDVFFIDASHGWVGGGKSSLELACTTDGGMSWARIEVKSDSSGFPAFPAKTIRFFGRERGYVLTGYQLFKTTDGGISWVGILINGRRIPLNSAFFLDFNTGFVFADSLYKTTDAGSHWRVIGDQAAPFCNEAYFRDSLSAWIVNGAGIETTFDGGAHWTKTPVPLGLSSIAFPDRRHGWAFGSAGIFATNDSGMTWQIQSQIAVTGKGRMFSATYGLAVGAAGAIYRTTNGGLNWHPLGSRVTNAHLFSVAYSDKREVWVAGGAGSHGELLSSQDTGKTWNLRHWQDSSWLRSIVFLNADSGWVCGENGTLLRSTDAGLSWFRIALNTNAHLWQLEFISPGRGWCAGEGVLLDTKDGGHSWTVHPTPNGYSIFSVCFIDSLTGVAVGGNQNAPAGVILRTTDGGGTWTMPYAQQGNPFRSVGFRDAENGWAFGDDVLKTMDGGLTWEIEVWRFGGIPTCAFFRSSIEGWVGTSSGLIFSTSDGGANWNPENSLSSGPFWAIAVDKAGAGIATGANGAIVAAEINGLNGVEGHAPHRQILDGIALTCYPNPFNSSTTIRYNLPRRSHVEIDLYDILGKWIGRLVSKVEGPGSHELRYNPKDLGSGIYLCRITAGGHTKTTKVMIVK